MKKFIYTLTVTVILVAFSAVPILASSTSEVLSSAQIAQIIANSDPVGYNSPYNKENFPQEYIEPLQGSLYLTENILYLPGKNGLDVSLTATYNSNEIGYGYCNGGTSFEYLFEKNAYYFSYDNNGTKKTILICPENQEAFTKLGDGGFYVKSIPSTPVTDDDDTEFYWLSNLNTSEQNIYLTYEAELSPVGLEWSTRTKLQKSDIHTERLNFSDIWKWNLPVMMESIHPLVEDSDSTYKYYSQQTAFVDLDGDYCEAKFTYRKRTSSGNISNASLIINNSKGKFTGYYTGENIVDESKGITYRCAITDALGRTMFFTSDGFLCAVEDRFENIVKYTFQRASHDYGRLVSITDTLGRVVTLTYLDNDVSIYVNENGNGAKLYAQFKNICENSTYDVNEYLVSDNQYKSKIIRYEDDDTEYIKIFNYAKWHQAWYQSYYSYHEPIECEVVLCAEQPNGIKTYYNYERKQYNAEGVNKRIYSVSERYDKDGTSTFNKYNYTYNPNTDSVVTREGDATVVTYVGDDYIDYKTTVLGKEKFTEDYFYKSSNGKRRVSYIKQTYKSGSKIANERTVYTSLNSLWQNTRIAYDDYEKTITYHGNSNFTESVVYNQSEEVYVKTTYVLSEAGDDYYTGRTIDSATVWESTDGGETYTEKYTVLYTYNSDGTLASETVDPDGINQVTDYTYEYGADGSITTTATITNLTDADGNNVEDITTSTTVDYQGRVVKKVDGNGNITRYEYDGVGRLVKVTNPDNTTKTYEYDTLNRTTILKDENGVMEKAEYDGFGNLIAAYKNIGTEASPIWAAVCRYEYDTLCRPVTMYEYTAHNGATPIKWTKTHYSYGAYDAVSEIIVYDENETELSKQTYTYNYADRTTQLPALGHDSINKGSYYQFTSVTISTEAKDGIAPPTIKQYYDRRGRLCKQIRTNGDTNLTTTYTYNAVDNVLEVKDEAAYAEFDVDYSQKYEYNYRDKVTRAYNAEGNYTEKVYDVLGRAVSETDYMGNSIVYTYDSIGRVLTETAPVDEGVTSSKKYYYDGNSNVVKITMSTAAGDVEYTYAYDSRNRLLSEFDGSTYTLCEYSGNRIIRTASGITSPDNVEISELSPYDANYNVSFYAYDNRGNMASETTFNGETAYTYDLTGKVLTTTDPSENTITNTYDSRGNLISSNANGDIINYTYNSFGLVTNISRNGESTAYTYDNFGRNISETTGTKVIERSYNTLGQVVSMNLSNGEEVLQSAEYEYNVLGKMTSATDGADTVTYTYNANGFPIGEEKGAFITSYEYTPGNLMKNTTHTYRRINDPTYEEGYNDIRNTSSFTYTYYPDGNVETVTDTRGSTTYCTNYVYDSANRLTNAVITNGDSTVRSWTYAYNNLGDRISQTVTDSDGLSATTSYAYTNHRLTSETTGDLVTSYTYDANGNAITKSNESTSYLYTYTPRNEVASVTVNGVVFSYTYNAGGLRTSVTTGDETTYFTWAGDNIIRKEDSNTATEYFYGINRVSRTVTGDAYTYEVTDSYYDETLGDRVTTVTPVDGYREFYAYDGRGNVVHTLTRDLVDLYINPHYGAAAPFPEVDLNEDGLTDFTDLMMALNTYPIVQNYYYSPFGEIWKGEKGNDINNFRYAGEYLDTVTGDIYLRTRYYCPSNGRFISVDPIKDGTNWYVYCGNNPIAFVDPSGRCYWSNGKWGHDKWEFIGVYERKPNPNIEKIAQNATYYSQTDSRWENVPYTVTDINWTIGTSGCGTTSMAMVISTLTGEKITPEMVSEYSVNNGHRTESQGTASTLYGDIASEYGLQASSVKWNFDTKSIAASFNGETMVIASLRNGSVAHSDHIVVIAGVVEYNDKQYFVVYDPNYENAYEKGYYNSSKGVMAQGNGKVYVPSDVMVKDVKYTVKISKEK